MFLSSRVAQQKIEEHEENLGSPHVAIEPQFQARIQKAADLINQKNPEVLKNITDIIGHLEAGPFGRFTESNPHTIYVNIQKLENEIKSRLTGQPDNVIQQELDNQIVKTIMHEATHQKEVSETGHSSESGPDAAEKQADQFLQPTQLASLSYRKADLINKLNPPKVEDNFVLFIEDSEPGDETSNDSPHMCSVTEPQDAVDVYREWITDNRWGAEKAPVAFILNHGKKVLRISYNGRLWNLDGSEFKKQ